MLQNTVVYVGSYVVILTSELTVFGVCVSPELDSADVQL